MRDAIDFQALASALLDRAEQLLDQWLPGGKRVGPEYECADLNGGHGSSCKVNVRTGMWSDFATGDKGGDLISLYAAVHGINNGKAARQLMDLLGWASPQQSGTTYRVPAQAKRPEPPPVDKDDQRSRYQPIVPVPSHAPQTALYHWTRGKPAASWAYIVDGVLWGHVARYTTSDGGKDVLPWTYCRDTRGDRGECKWHQKQWPEPRPLFLPSGLKPSGGAVITVIVEGEKCAVALHELLQQSKAGAWQVVSWPGGGNAWDKAAWEWLQVCVGGPVILWPDCDAKHEKLTKAEQAAGVDEASKPLRPPNRQPGIQAMTKIAGRLQAMGCAVSMCAIPAPGEVPDGWDCYDAIAEGWTLERVEEFLLNAPALESPPPAGQAPQPDQPLQPAGAGRAPNKWQSCLLRTDKGGVKACRENVVLALDGIPADGVVGIESASGVIAFNEFTNNVMKLKPTPWGTSAGEWLEEDELEMGNWLVHKHYLPPMPRTALEEAVKMVAGRHRYHPVRQYLATVRGKWDGVRRLSSWLKRVCQAQAPEGLEDITDKYLARVGSWLVMAMVARVMEPGCKFDYMVIFEGAQGMGKSTLARTLGGEWFADTGLVMGEKDAYQNLQGVLVYEVGELDSMNRAEVTKVKAFASSQKDRFRASFDRRPRDYPRQVVFVGTTNEDHYLTDQTGNRRFWPVRVGGPIDVAWVREHRDQLFAEALEAFEAGHRFHPTQDEQRELFDPQQSARTVELPIEARIMAYLYDENYKVPHGDLVGAHVNEITTTALLAAIGIGIEKQVTAPSLTKQANAIIKKLGWREGKSSGKGGAKRVNVWKRPAQEQQPAQVQGHDISETEHDAVPF